MCSPSPLSHSLRSSLRRASHLPSKLRVLVPNIQQRSNDTKRTGPDGGRVSAGMAEVDASSLDELSRFEPPERPPTLAQLQELTARRFSEEWLKYIYNRFKHECPSGRMKFPEFRRLLGVFIPDRLSDAYLERMFRAFCQCPSSDYLTFKDLIIALHRLCDDNARAKAEWTMRLISQQDPAPRGKQQQISYHVTDRTPPPPRLRSATPCSLSILQEFYQFVRSVFTLRGRGELHERKRRAGSLLLGGTGPCSSRHDSTSRRPPTVRSVALLASAITAPTAAPALAHFGRARGSSATDGDSVMRAISAQRASLVFKELDVEDKGFLTADDFERFFARQQQRDH